MKIINVGYNHCHDSDFYIDRPEGSGDNLLILLKTDAVFNIDGKDIKIPENSFFMYKKGDRSGTDVYIRAFLQMTGFILNLREMRKRSFSILVWIMKLLF